MEECAGKAFNNFLVHDSHDYHELKELCLTEGLKFPPCIIIGLDSQRHTIDKGLPPDNVLTMYHKLSCSEENFASAVMNSLVDQASSCCISCACLDLFLKGCLSQAHVILQLRAKFGDIDLLPARWCLALGSI